MAHGGKEVALQAVHLVEMQIGLCQLVDLVVEIAIGLAEILLRVDKAPEHPIEGDPELFELVGRVDLGPGLHVATPHLVGHVPQVLERLHDHVADDRVGGEHREKHGHDRRGGENGPVPVDRLAGCRIGHHHLHHRHEIVVGEQHPGPAGGLGIGGGRGVADHAEIFVAAGAAAPPPDRLVVVVFRVVSRTKLPVFRGGRRRPALRCGVGPAIPEVGEHGGVEAGVFAPFLGGGVGLEQPALVLLALQRAAQEIDRAGVLLLRFERLPVVLQHDRIDEMPARAPRRRVDK